MIDSYVKGSGITIKSNFILFSIMKKLLLSAALVAMLGLASCSTINQSSAVVPVLTEVVSQSTVDLKVAPQKIQYTLNPSKAVRKGGDQNVINTAVAEALKANGNADVLVGMQYKIKRTRNLFGVTKIKYVTVEGYPATYVNFTPTTR